MKGVIVLLLSWLLPVTAMASGNDALEARFHEANAAYRNGDFPTAEAAYREIIDGGLVDGDVLYNLGNALYREERKGAAILAWKRAEVLLPRDPDLRANLDRAREEVKDRLDAPSWIPAALFWQHGLALGESSLLGALCTGAAFLLLTLNNLAKPRNGDDRWSRIRAGLPFRSLAGGLGCVGLILVFSTVWAARGLVQRAPGVILAPEVTAWSALKGQGVALFILHEGAEVRILEAAEGEVLVGLPDARRGWMPAASVASVNPSDPFPGTSSASSRP